MSNAAIYFDNAASTPLDPRVLEAMMPYLSEHFGNPSSVHGYGRKLKAAIEEARATVAHLLNCSTSEIVFTSGGTEADNQVLRQAVIGHGIRRVISTAIEHHAVCHTLEEIHRRDGVEHSLLAVDATGNIDLGELEALLKQPTPTLVSLMHANNELGTLNPVAEIAALCSAHGALFHSDTTQTVGHLPIDLQAWPVHFIVASAHKFYGPKGVGFLFRREGTQLPSLLAGGGQERNQRAGTENVAFIVGLAKALELCVAEQAAHLAHLRGLKDYAMQRMLTELVGVSFNGETGAETSVPWVLNVAFPGEDTESLVLFNLDIMGIAASGGSACTSGSVNPSHVLSALGHSTTRIANSIRFSFGVQNTREEIDRLVSVLKQVVRVPVQALAR
jgi:cysteine desulfurase